MANQAGTTDRWFNETDEKYVERIRHFLVGYKLLKWLLLVPGVILILFLVLGYGWLWKTAAGWVVSPQGSAKDLLLHVLLSGFIVGVLVGGFFGLMLFQFIWFLFEMILGSRSDRLLLHYHDALRDLVLDSSHNPDTKA